MIKGLKIPAVGVPTVVEIDENDVHKSLSGAIGCRNYAKVELPDFTVWADEDGRAMRKPVNLPVTILIHSIYVAHGKKWDLLGKKDAIMGDAVLLGDEYREADELFHSISLERSMVRWYITPWIGASDLGLCNVCNALPAVYDAPLTQEAERQNKNPMYAPWGLICIICMQEYGSVRLGEGHGQIVVNHEEWSKLYE